MQHHFHLHQEPFEKIKNGSKTVESRLYDNKRRLINVGDTIVFTSRHTHESIEKKISNIQIFNSFSEMLAQIQIHTFGNDSIEKELQGLQEYYSLEDQQTYGVVALFLY